MYKIVACEKRKGRHTLTIEGVFSSISDELINVSYELPDGTLESYMGAYNLLSGEALTMLLADACMDEITAPAIDDPDVAKKIFEIKRAAVGKIVWEIDKDEALSSITLAEDHAKDMVGQWAAFRDEVISSPTVTTEDIAEKARIRKKEYAAGYQRSLEERHGDEHVSTLVAERNKELMKNSYNWRREK